MMSNPAQRKYINISASELWAKSNLRDQIEMEMRIFVDILFAARLLNVQMKHFCLKQISQPSLYFRCLKYILKDFFTKIITHFVFNT